MTRALLLALASGLAVTASSAPIPEQDDATKLARAYGHWSDPDKDCRYKLSGDVLTISLPKAIHYIAKDKKSPQRVPCVLRDVTGDFTAVVRVKCPETVRVTREGICCVSGGLLIRSPDGDFFSIRVFTGAYYSQNGVLTRHDPAGVTLDTLDGPVKPMFVRVRREGRTVTSDYSEDGKKWSGPDPENVGWPGTVRVGVVAENCLGLPAEVTFDRYSLTQPKKQPEPTP